MPLIKCPVCGKKVSDQERICVQCGYPIAKKAAPKTMDEYLNGSANPEQRSPGRKIRYAIDSTETEQRSPARKKRYAICGAVLLAAVIAVVLFLVLKPKNQIPDLRLEVGMTNDEIVEQLKKKGYVFNGDWYNRFGEYIFSAPEDVLGVRPSYIRIYNYPTNVQINFYFLWAGYNYQFVPERCPRHKDLESVFIQLAENATALLGEPESDTSNPASPKYRWKTDNISYNLYNNGKYKIVGLGIVIYK